MLEYGIYRVWSKRGWYLCGFVKEVILRYYCDFFNGYNGENI